MKLKKHLISFFSLLLMAMFLFTGCSPEAEELALDVLDAVLEAELEEETALNEEELPDESLSEGTLSEEDSQLEASQAGETNTSQEPLPEDGTYTSKEDVAAYLHQYGHLPSNFITKKAAKKLGWVSSEGNLGEVAPGMSIGGDYFGNYEGNLPEADGREYHECDIDSDGGYRGAKRIVYSNDGLIYYTEDHYESFELLYGEE